MRFLMSSAREKINHFCWSRYKTVTQVFVTLRQDASLNDHRQATDKYHGVELSIEIKGCLKIFQ